MLYLMLIYRRVIPAKRPPADAAHGLAALTVGGTLSGVVAAHSVIIASFASNHNAYGPLPFLNTRAFRSPLNTILHLGMLNCPGGSGAAFLYQ